jgi:hypothetical protein
VRVLARVLKFGNCVFTSIFLVLKGAVLSNCLGTTTARQLVPRNAPEGAYEERSLIGQNVASEDNRGLKVTQKKYAFNNYFIPNAFVWADSGILNTPMPEIYPSSYDSRCRFPLPSDQGNFVSIESVHSWPMEATIRDAVQILSEHDLALPELDRLAVIVRSALTAQTLFYAAALHRPGRTELYQFFESFVLSCVTLTRETEGE